MKIEIITTGDEVVQGTIVDTNSAWIAWRSARLGCEIVRHTSVGDYSEAIGEACVAASKRADTVIVTGGLGPTADDITLEAAAQAFGVKLIIDDSVLADIRDFFTRVGRPMSTSNEKQALVPEKGIVLKNPVGTAPGIRVKLGNAWFFFLPGVPKELYQIFDESVMPWLAGHATGAVHEHVLRCFGVPEASIDERLKGTDLADCRLSFRVRFPEILLKVLARAETESEARKMTEAAGSAIRDQLGDIVYGEGETSLAQVVGTLLSEKGMTIVVAESCTGGHLADVITNVPGASAYFESGVVSYSNRSKMELLGVAEDILKAHGAVSRETAMALAEGIRRMSGASIGVGITGIAGPGGGSPEKPIGTVHIAIASPDGTSSQEFVFGRDRLSFKQLVAWTALDMVRKYLVSA